MGEKPYKIITTRAMVILDRVGNPVDGILIVFSFGLENTGELKIAKSAATRDKIDAEITAYVKMMTEIGAE